MTDVIELTPGAPPWLPTPETETLHVLDEYNIPLAGLVKQQGHVYLYVCAAGEEQEDNVWLYAMVEEHEVQRLTDSGPTTLVRSMADPLQHRRVTAALADHWKLALWDVFDTANDNPGKIVRQFLRLLNIRVRRYGDNIGRLEQDPSLDDESPQAVLTF